MGLQQYNAVNREAIWAALFAYLQGKLTAPPWVAATAYAAGQACVDPQGHLQQAITAGTSGATPPTWNDSEGTTPDGSGGTAFTWQDKGQGVCSMGRKHIPPPDLTLPDQPALFIIAVKEHHAPRPAGVPTKLTLRGFLILYAPAPVVNQDIGSETQLGETTLNVLFQAIDTALMPDNLSTGKFTIGGLVEHCWIEDDTDLDPGIFTNQAAAIIPLRILVP